MQLRLNLRKSSLSALCRGEHKRERGRGHVDRETRLNMVRLS